VTGLAETEQTDQLDGGVVGEGFDLAVELGAAQAHFGGEGIDVDVGVADALAEDGEEAVVEVGVYTGEGGGGDVKTCRFSPLDPDFGEEDEGEAVQMALMRRRLAMREAQRARRTSVLKGLER
jgi:hypothetical protein